MTSPVDSYARGDTIYGNGSHAPTSGTVDPTGYVTREMNKQTAPGGPSQKRSGLASAAMDRISGYEDNGTQMPPTGAIAQLPSFTINDIGQLIPVNPALDPTPSMPGMGDPSQLGGLPPGAPGATPTGMPPGISPNMLAQAAQQKLGGQ